MSHTYLPTVRAELPGVFTSSALGDERLIDRFQGRARVVPIGKLAGEDKTLRQDRRVPNPNFPEEDALAKVFEEDVVREVEGSSPDEFFDRPSSEDDGDWIGGLFRHPQDEGLLPGGPLTRRDDEDPRSGGWGESAFGGGGHSPSVSRSGHTGRGAREPATERLAFYASFHFFDDASWGIYLLGSGVRTLTGKIYHFGHGRIAAHEALQAAKVFLFGHEFFHHKVDCLALRMETTHEKPIYADPTWGFVAAYRDSFGSDHCLEEALANGAALQKVQAALRSSPSSNLIGQALREFVRHSPPGYCKGGDYLAASAFDKARTELAEKYFERGFGRRRNPDIWYPSLHMFDPIINKASRVNYLLPWNTMHSRTRLSS